MRFPKWITILLFSIVLINSSYATSISNKNQTSYLNKQELEWIKNHPSLNVHNESDWAPFNFNVNGQASGFSIEYMNLLAERAGFKIDYINGPSWNDFLSMIQDGSLDVMINIVMTPERLKYLSFTPIYAIVSPVLAIRNKDNDVFSFNDFGDKTLCVPQGSASHEYLKNNHPEINLHPLKDSLACLKAMQSDEVDITMEGDAILQNLLTKNNIQDIRISKIAIDAEMASELRIATSNNNPILRTILEKTMGEIDKVRVSQLHKKWLEVKHYKKTELHTVNTNLFSTTELAWIKSHPILRVGNEMDWSPFNFVDNNQANGYSIDLLNLIGKKSGLKFNYINGYSWSELLILFKNKELDIIPSLYEVEGRSAFTLFTSSYLENKTVLAMMGNAGGNITLEDMTGKRLAVQAGGNYETYLRKNHPKIILIPFAMMFEGINAVLDKSVDAYIGSRADVSYAINKEMIYGLSLIGLSEMDNPENTALKMGIRKDYPILHSIIEKSLLSISEVERNQLRSRWLPSIKKSPENIKNSLNFTLITLYVLLAIFSLVLLLSYFSRKMSNQNKFGLQTGTRQFRIIMLLSLGIFISVIVLFSWLEMIKIKSKIIYDLESNLKQTLVTTIDRLNNWVAQEEFMLLQLAKTPTLIKETERLLQLKTEKSILIKSNEQKNIRRLVASNSISVGLGFFIINKNGISIASKRDSNIGSKNLIAIQRPEKLISVFDGESTFVPPIYSDIEKNTSSLFIAVPIKDKQNQVIAVLTKRLEPTDKFSQVLQFSRVGISGETYAFDHNGTLLSESRFENDLRAIGLINDLQSSVMNIQIRDPGINLLETDFREYKRNNLPLTLMANSTINSIKDDAFQVMNTEHRVQSDIIGYSDYRGVPVVGAWVWEKHLGMGLTSEMDVDEAYSTYHSIQRALISIIGITIILLIGGTFFILVMGEKTNKITTQSKKELEDKVNERTKALQFSEEKSRSIVTNASECIITINEQQKIIAFNPASEETFGYSIDEIMGQPIEILLPKDRQATHSQYIENCKSDSVTSKDMKSRNGISGRRKNGDLFPAEASISRSTVNNKSYFTAFVKDISKRVEAEMAMAEAKEQAEQANKAKSTFLANMSHELRTPMNAIIGYSEMLIEDAEDDENEDIIPDLSKINSAGRHLLELINDILDLSKIEAGKMELYLENLNLQSLLQEVIDTSKPLIDKNNNVLKLTFDETIGIIHGDAMKIKQSLFNLISNAAKFTDQGEIAITVSKIKYNNVESIGIAISDNGIGIPENKLDTVFEEFSQADDSTTKDYGGTGLGLPLSVKFCQMMGGDLTLTSEVGKGSTFTMTIPAIAIKENKIDEESMIQPDLSESSAHHSVLIIDDDSNSRDILQRYLEKENYKVYLATNSEMGVQVAHKYKPDVITLDIMMPGKDGWATLQLLKNNPVTQNIPVIMISIVSDKETAVTLGAVDALMKPIDKNLLIETLNHHIDKKSKKHVLVIDDEQMNRDLISRYLGDEGFSLFQAANGEEGINLLDTVKPDLILLDLMMPVMGGFEFLEIIRQKEDYNLVPIIVITSKSLSNDELNYLKAHTTGVLQKGDLTKSDLNSQLKAILK
ncbi:response regulator [Colwellia sp. 12G3]|uniref:response regulator n=1 Tax=Colwellia sp. 12G3 TaxID=2058299 RepID=UPI0018E3835E|nr:transporter substrate-binding domain-containing protein [Colwellia sp. 12G3]